MRLDARSGSLFLEFDGSASWPPELSDGMAYRPGATFCVDTELAGWNIPGEYGNCPGRNSGRCQLLCLGHNRSDRRYQRILCASRYRRTELSGDHSLPPG